jgi:TetR/AcrR family transcriptional repressor of nem operon
MDWEARLAACLRLGQARGEVGAGRDCARLAHFFWIGWEGAVLRAKLRRSGEPLRIFAEGFFALLA